MLSFAGMATVARGYGWIAGFSSCFQLFEPYKRVPDGWRATSQSSDGRAKLHVAVLLLPFLVETFPRHGFWRTASASTGGVSGPNRASLAGIDVEKMRGEGAPPLARSVNQMAHVCEIFKSAPLSTGNRLVQVNHVVLQRTQHRLVKRFYA